mmetsp:Transcript_5328/g.15195  ORF Transcript_5328/g.15195 Transcript_5328/m.15195 type:complete len:223 (+) Transcript_5328:142-810(+)
MKTNDAKTVPTMRAIKLITTTKAYEIRINSSFLAVNWHCVPVWGCLQKQTWSLQTPRPSTHAGSQVADSGSGSTPVLLAVAAVDVVVATEVVVVVDQTSVVAAAVVAVAVVGATVVVTPATDWSVLMTIGSYLPVDCTSSASNRLIVSLDPTSSSSSSSWAGDNVTEGWMADWEPSLRGSFARKLVPFTISARLTMVRKARTHCRQVMSVQNDDTCFSHYIR